MNLSRYWTNSIDLPEGSSGGRSPISCTAPWDLRLSDFDDITHSEYTFIYNNIEHETTYNVTITLKTDHLDDKITRERFLACALIGAMPEPGVEEALSSLLDMLQFYSKKRLVLAVPKAKPETISATITARKKRPDLVITA